MQDIKQYIKDNKDEMYRILRDLCLIPAPSGHEEARAEYCRRWFAENGMPEAYTDEALNVIYPYDATGDALTVLVAHTDTVFPDTEPMPYSDDGEAICSPGVGDDTASVAVLMLTAKYFIEKRIKTGGVLFVLNSGEEGLGNLKGTRRIFADFAGRIKQFISFDSASLTRAADRCVGSHRYEVEVLTEGGHSWLRFGNKNAIAELSKLVNAIYSISLPEKEGSKVSYNVGEISGGTSVNTIAQSAKMLCEYRSDDEELLAFMKDEFARIFRDAEGDGVRVSINKIGDRPCAGKVELSKIGELKKTHAEIVRDILGEPMTYGSSSTDCNIPLSIGIPALCIGVYNGEKSHTREERIDKKSLITGLEIAIKASIKYTE